jgi:hypothetical protein
MAQVMSGRAHELAEQFKALTDEFGAFIGTLNADEWAARAVNSPIWNLGEDEKRSCAPIAFHTADGIAIHTAMLKDAAEGKPLPVPGGSWTLEGVAQWNADMAEQHANVTQAEVLGVLSANSARALELIRGLSDDQLERRLSDLDRENTGPFNPELYTVGQIIEQMLIGHVQVHLSSLKATVGR